ncbi:MAG: hypothetical protein ACREDP_20450, partial [Bradyrhizobium sp.]
GKNKRSRGETKEQEVVHRLSDMLRAANFSKAGPMTAWNIAMTIRRALLLILMTLGFLSAGVGILAAAGPTCKDGSVCPDNAACIEGGGCASRAAACAVGWRLGSDGGLFTSWNN